MSQNSRGIPDGMVEHSAFDLQSAHRTLQNKGQRKKQKEAKRLERLRKKRAKELKRQRRKNGGNTDATTDGIDANSPSNAPSTAPFAAPSAMPSSKPSLGPSVSPTTAPSVSLSSSPTLSIEPSSKPSFTPSYKPSGMPSLSPSTLPTSKPSDVPSRRPSAYPSLLPSMSPTYYPSAKPSMKPTGSPSVSSYPTLLPSDTPTLVPTEPLICGGLSRTERNEIVEATLLDFFPSGLHENATNWIVYEDDLDLCANDTFLEQRYILATLYFDTNGASWIKGSSGGRKWLSQKSECKWYDVECSDDGFVKSINLESNNMDGTIPYEIESLHSLQELNLEFNKLSGPFPLLPSSMLELKLNNNKLSGVLPEKWPPNMSLLQINHNKLSGSINSLSLVTTFRVLVLHRNEFNGTVGVHFGDLETYFSLHKNNLEGSIPEDVCLLRDGFTPKLSHLSADCLTDPTPPKVSCPSILFEDVPCCTECHN
eukprot:15363219-Ditylum_brightwellii.AAC.1